MTYLSQTSFSKTLKYIRQNYLVFWPFFFLYIGSSPYFYNVDGLQKKKKKLIKKSYKLKGDNGELNLITKAAFGLEKFLSWF